MLFATVIGSGLMGEQLAGGNIALALLGNTPTTAAMLLVLITMLGPVSGAQFNPAVMLVFALQRELAWGDAALYTLVQIVGGLGGAIVAHAMFDLPVFEIGSKERSGPGQWLGEAVATFALVLTILGTLRHRPHWVPLSVAAVITAGYWFTSSTSFANPAITVARSLTDSFSGIRPADALGFIVAQLAGALLAAACAHWLFDNGGPGPQAPAAGGPP
jgi:glycerol uptake facilitator-like aquaporin